MLNDFCPYIKWIMIFPFAGFLVNLFFGKKLSEKVSGSLASAAILLSFGCSLLCFRALLGLPEGTPALKETLYVWFAAGTLNIPVGFRFDNLSAVMALVVTGVSFLIHVYSMGYMRGDRDLKRFFASLNLFVFFMLILVLADNPVLMFVGWEGVGLCSCLLIGFWYENMDNARAGKKAFITNRVGDAAFLTGLVLLISFLNLAGVPGLDFDSLKANIGSLAGYSVKGLPLLTVISVLFFIGATGKSAQFPLYIWLPDAMAGPTPVSALIHAATMVTAGVYMVSRLFFMFEISPYALEVILYTCAFTALFSAVIATLQSDIKKILAYSTISQIGYMFMGAGAGMYAGGFFHLTTHAFFKALLFLAAGSVIHAMGGEQNIFKMGGLKGKIKYTFLLTLAGWITISGIPPFSAFYSKDLIIEEIYGSGHFWVWLSAVATAGLTAYYMTRLFKITFLGTPKTDAHAREAPPVMLVPMAVLAALSLAAGAFTGWFINFSGGEVTDARLPFLVKEAPLAAGLAGIALGFWLTKENLAAYLEKVFKPLHKLIYNKFYVDEIYEALVIAPLKVLSESFFFKFIDRTLIDEGMVDGTSRSFYFAGEFLRKAQNGNVQLYALFFAFGLLAVLAYILAAAL
ncbi:MAG: NADH-quinone oxidoreductase subunit L [Elusimicrobia bacterium CG08_land_8_20_14_0_20_51_18]|nr:MAG: NADH-quinone oxidoreductase subunit L [Elusimicrobia bacterium CG08_land_8_20_14_0_20_51_18]